MRLMPSRKRYRCTVCGATMLLKTKPRFSFRQAVVAAVSFVVVLLGTWLWLSYEEAAQKRLEQRMIEWIE